MDNINLNSFLKFGYFLDYEGAKDIFKFNAFKEDLSSYSKADLICEGGKFFQSAINADFNINEKHLVPLSGGLDSRAILAGLLENTSAKNIHTFTFGQPGSLDYDIGNYLAKTIGTTHQIYDLRKLHWSQEELINTARRFNLQTNLFYHPDTSQILEDYNGFKYWSGFMGDPIAGSHLDKYEKPKNAKRNFVRKNTFVRSIDLCCCEDSDFFDKIEINQRHRGLLSDGENLDFENRQKKYIAPHVLFDGLKIKKPFLNKNWSSFMLSLETDYRHQTSLYEEILLNQYPFLFSKPTKCNLGLGLRPNKLKFAGKKLLLRVKSRLPNFKSPNLNYLDFNQEIKTNQNLRSILVEQTQDLDKRNIIDWIDFDKIWTSQLVNNQNHSNALITLASLEINLKAGKEL